MCTHMHSCTHVHGDMCSRTSLWYLVLTQRGGNSVLCTLTLPLTMTLTQLDVYFEPESDLIPDPERAS